MEPLVEGQLVHVIVREDENSEYIFDLGVVIHAFDNFIIVRCRRMLRNGKTNLQNYTIYYDQVKESDYDRESNVECLPLMKDGQPVFSDIVNGVYTFLPVLKDKKFDNPSKFMISSMILVAFTLGAVFGIFVLHSSHL